jgi:hypothetical protein
MVEHNQLYALLPLILSNAKKNAEMKAELDKMYKKINKNIKKIEKGLKSLESCQAGKKFKQVSEIWTEPDIVTENHQLKRK